MYNAYGSNVFKKYQVNMGNPYPVKPKKASPLAINQEPEVQSRPNVQDGEEILEKARLEAQKIIQKANLEAEGLLMEAQDKIITQMMEAEQKAKEEGYRNGEALAREHYQALLNEAEELRENAQEVYHQTVSSLEKDIVETILEIGRKVIGMELVQNRDVILGLIRKALLGTSPAGEITVRVSPDDFDYVQENKDNLITGMKNIGDLIIKKDASLDKGGCLVETGFGSVDSSIETQLSEVESCFRQLLGQSSEIEAEAAASEEF